MAYKEPESHPLEWLVGGDTDLLKSKIPNYKDLKVKVVTPLEIEENLKNPTDEEIKKYFELEDSSYLNIFFTGENCKAGNLFGFPCEDYLDRWEEIDLRLGFDRGGHNNYLRYPLWVLYYDPRWTNFSNPESRITHSFSHVASHSAGGVRDKVCALIENLGVKIHQYGKFQHNDDALWNDGDDKLGIISKSTFNICCENYSEPGYITEKIFEALGAGCIPIYWGDSGLEPIINKAKVIIIDPDIPESFDSLKELLENDQALRMMSALHPFNANIKDCIDTYKKLFLELFKDTYNKKFGVKI